MRRLKLLQDMPVFGGVRNDILTFLLQLAPVIRVCIGDFFFHEGDDARSMFVLEEGTVAIFKTWKGRSVALGHLRQGDCFGEMALIDLFPRSASVQADEDCLAIELSSATLFEVYNRDLEQFTLIQMNVARELSRRLRSADERLFRALAQTEVMEQSLSIST
ncbi:MAG: cyclic nucleotide-binding domain-containing protein [Gammaproteobacteria bacterium]